MTEKEKALAAILSTMHLRQPQSEALKAFHAVLNSIDTPLSEMSNMEIINAFRKYYPDWNYRSGLAEFTFHLATGVGKTRLIGAVMAYLFNAHESQNFLIVSPRAEIIRKFQHVCQPTSSDYIFVDQNLVGIPHIMDGESIVYGGTILDEMYTGPKIWIMTPQSLTAKDAKIKRKNEYDTCSTVEYIQSLDDLVVFFDESHHLGYDKKTDSVWHSEIRNLKPKMIIGTTASVDTDDNSTNVIYSYDLKQCLNESLYTKLVQIIPDKKDANMSDEDYDAIVLRFGWQQLLYKQKVINDFEKANYIDKKVKAVMLVACQDINHAEQVADWFKRFLGKKESVLLVHSKMRESEFLPSLENIENPLSPVRVVVNVAKLNEGWDVSNIYVITPLRAMASSTLVTQIMGRGLRLPYGIQTGNEDIDTLDVLCFGRETMQEICDKLLQEGYGVNSGGMTVVDPPKDLDHPEKEFVPTKKYQLKVVRDPHTLRIPLFKLKRPLLNIDAVSLPALKADTLHSFMISDPRTIKKLNGNLSFERDAFLGIVSSEVLRQCSYLSYAKHYLSVYSLVQRFLEVCGYSEGSIPLEPEKVILHIKKNLDFLSRQVPASYVSMDVEQIIDLDSQEINVPETLKEPLDSILFDTKKWATRKHRGIPFKGWVRSLFEAVPFDQVNELKIAKIIDRSEEVTWWFRNLPGMITLPTPAGAYSPDFAIFFSINEMNVLLEIKGDVYYGSDNADATIKANAAKAWCEAQTAASGKPWQYWFLLDSDADICMTFDDIRENADIYPEESSHSYSYSYDFEMPELMVAEDKYHYGNKQE